MIRRFNYTQIALGVLNLFAATLASAIIVLAFFHSTRFALEFLPIAAPPETPAIIASAALAVVFITGLRRGRNQSALDTPQHPDHSLNLEPITGGSAFIHAEASKIVAPAIILVQVFLSAPLQLLEGIDRFRSLLRYSSQLETDLHQLLSEVNAKKKWHPVKNYAGREQQLACLIRMNRIDFSPRKGTVSPK